MKARRVHDRSPLPTSLTDTPPRCDGHHGLLTTLRHPTTKPAPNPRIPYPGPQLSTPPTGHTTRTRAPSSPPFCSRAPPSSSTASIVPICGASLKQPTYHPVSGGKGACSGGSPVWAMGTTSACSTRPVEGWLGGVGYRGERRSRRRERN